MADRMSPFRGLWKPDTPFYWDMQLNALFQEREAVIVREIEHGEHIFDERLTDLYRYGFLQNWHRVLAPSKALFMPRH